MNQLLVQSFIQRCLASAALLVIACPAFAGDVIGEIAEPDIIAPTRIAEDVSAFYLGLSAGYGDGGSDRFGLSVAGNTFPVGELEPQGTYGGVRGGWRGYLPTFGGREYVYGIEVGYDFGTLEDDVTTQIGGTIVDAASEISDIWSVRLRNGVTNRSGNILYFVTVGYVQGEITTRNTLTAGGISDTAEDIDTRNGFSASLGAEHKINENWSITGEIEYLQFESERVDLGTGLATKSTPNYRGLRFGLNYTF